MTKTLLTLFLFAAAVFAQSAFIGLPTAGQTVTLGSELVVQIQTPDSLTSVQEVAVVIGINPCVNNNCPSPFQSMGTVLYNGPYDPQFHIISGLPNLPPYENFTVQVPSSIPTGPAIIGVLHLALVGDVEGPLYEALNQSITIV